MLAKLVRIDKQITDALMTVKKYVKYATGSEATQEEIANTLKCYFINNEIGNQIRYRRSNEPSEEDLPHSSRRPFWTFNLMAGSQKNSLAKAGLFPESIQEGIQATMDFVKKTTGKKPSRTEIAESLKCTFILSEIKNHIDWQRKNPQKASGSDLTF